MKTILKILIVFLLLVPFVIAPTPITRNSAHIPAGVLMLLPTEDIPAPRLDRRPEVVEDLFEAHLGGAVPNGEAQNIPRPDRRLEVSEDLSESHIDSEAPNIPRPDRRNSNAELVGDIIH